MDALFNSDIGLIVTIQSMGDWLVISMKLFSHLVTDNFSFLALPLLFWCVDVSLGMRVGLILITSEVFNYAAKLVFAGSRPYWMSSEVKGLWPETSFGIPSGHAQNAMSGWGMVALYMKRTWVWTACGFTIFVIGFSRLYLGSHFLHDVVLGWVIGAVLVFAFNRLWDRTREYLLRKAFWQQIIIAFVASMVLIVIGCSAATLRKGFEVPQ